ncbi:MAG: GGDEF domain-containing protein [Acetobacteraceae bacterium]|nr:GGDEF domain-containing protein [Acetobacteraceae bacterium]
MPRYPDSENRDPLTGAATEPALLRFTKAVLDLADPQSLPVGFLLIDIDGLREIVACFGAEAGDAVLLGVADRLQEDVRGHDLVGRVAAGFGICMPDLLPAQARGAAERLRRRLGEAPLPTPAGNLGITCSIGLALGNDPGLGPVELMTRAQLALQEAQQAGGNRVVTAG